jgi:hypothetical protein
VIVGRVIESLADAAVVVGASGEEVEAVKRGTRGGCLPP